MTTGSMARWGWGSGGTGRFRSRVRSSYEEVESVCPTGGITCCVLLLGVFAPFATSHDKRAVVVTYDSESVRLTSLNEGVSV